MVTVDAVERRVGQFFLVWNALVVWNILTQSLHYRLRNAYGPAKARGGGVCILVNVRWATDVKIVSKNCSADIETFTIICRPFYMPREFSSIIMTAVSS